jgi:uncharacterized protein YggE
MKRFLIASMFSAALLVVPFASLPAGAVNKSDEVDCKQGVVSVSYTAEKEVSPDTVQISIAVKTTDKYAMQNATKQNKEISDKIYNYLKGAINPANNDYIKTSNYSARPVYLYQDRKQVFDKYEVSNNIIVHTKSIDKIAQMIDKSLTLGATNVDSLNFSLSEKDKYCDELLAKATSEVVKRANVVAGAAGTSVDGVKSLGTSCSLNQYQAVNYARNSLMMAKSAVAEDSAMGSSSPIEAGVIKVYSTVNGVFRLK